DAVKLVHEANLSLPEVQDMVAHINDTRSTAKQRQYVRHLRQDVYGEAIGARKAGDTSGQKGVRTRSPKQAWAMLLGLGPTLPPMQVVSESLSEPERGALRERVVSMITTLTTGLAVLDGKR